MTSADFTAWLSTAAIGETFTYYIGFIARDRADETNSHTKEVVRRAVPGLDALADRLLADGRRPARLFGRQADCRAAGSEGSGITHS